MPQEVEINVPPGSIESEAFIRNEIAQKLKLKSDSFQFVIHKRSIDSRHKPIYRLKILVFTLGEKIELPNYAPKENKVSKQKEVHIIGSGPAGLFAAIKLIELNIKPILIERGKNIKERRRDLAELTKNQKVNPNSNYCFGEGGAGTYSDGKLYTRSGKRGNINEILSLFVHFGANPDILVDAHPHIGTNKLPGIIENIRNFILENGGEILFNHKLTDIIIEKNEVKGIVCENTLQENDSKHFTCSKLLLATGHSARDIFELLHAKNILIEAKDFALGVRIEHPQEHIDCIQYHCDSNERTKLRKNLPAAAYSWVEQVNNTGVYSFCMCPGGIIAPCATAQEEIVTNGWSPSKRNNPFANSGIVVSVKAENIKSFEKYGALASLRFQQSIEKAAWEAGGKTQTAPAQRLQDFIQNKTSGNLPACSYIPGITSYPLHELLPDFIRKSLQQAFINTGNKWKGYVSNEAVLVGVESRTSSPVRIPRHSESLQHLEIKGLYPCGEGAGYAGGIVSAAIDGIKCAVACSVN